MLETLAQAKELSESALKNGDGEAQAEDEAVQLLRTKEYLERQLPEIIRPVPDSDPKPDRRKLEESKDAHNQLSATVQGFDSNLASLRAELTSYEEAISEGPARKARLLEVKKELEAEQLELAEKMADLESQIAGLVEEKARLNIEKKKLGKKEVRVTSLKETLATMQEMEADNRRKAEELAAMDEMMRGKMEEMQKMQKMMQSMMAQVMAGMGDLDGTGGDDDENDEDTAAETAAGSTISEADKQKQMIENLVAKVDTMVTEIQQSQVAVGDKITATDAALSDTEAEKAGLTEMVEINATSIAKATTDIDNCLETDTLIRLKAAKQQELASLEAQERDAREQMTAMEATVNAAQQNLEGHTNSVASLHQVVHDTHMVMADWEVKMRKHIQKRKRLVALSNTFNVDIQDIQNRANDEGAHFKDNLRPVVVSAIEQLNELLAQLDKQP